MMEYWIGLYRAEFFVVKGVQGEFTVFSFQFTVVVCGVVLRGTCR